MERPKRVNDVVAQTSVKVNDVMTHPGKRCRDTYQVGDKITLQVALEQVGIFRW